MDPENNEVNASPVTETSSVSFPSVSQSPQSPKKGAGKTVLVIALLILLASVGFVIYKSSSDSNEEIEVEETPIGVDTSTQATSTPIATASSAPVKKETVSIKVQNGTGITGEAAFLVNQLKALGYTDVEAANATSQNETVTTVTYDKALSSVVTDEITKKLKEIYKEVEVKTATGTPSNDVVIVTGLRKSQTAKPSATATPKASATSSASPKASTTATPTPTPTAT